MDGSYNRFYLDGASRDFFSGATGSNGNYRFHV